jgi:hypothetical protein
LQLVREWRRLIDTDLFGAINVRRAALPRLRGQRSGHLVQMSSLNGVEGLPGGDYADGVGQVREQLEQLDGQQPGDPARAARVIVDAVEAETLPRRLPLGTMALEHIRAKLTSQLEELGGVGRAERVDRLHTPVATTAGAPGAAWPRPA